MQVDHNTINLVRALVKLSSAITDIDNISDHEKFKFQLKKYLLSWQAWIEEYTNDSMVKLTKADDEVLMTLINTYDEFDERLVSDDRLKAGINIILAKANSALRDLDAMKGPYIEYVAPLRAKLVQLVGMGVLTQHINGEILIELTTEMNDISDKVIIGTL